MRDGSGVFLVRNEHVADNELMMAGSVVTILPVLAVFVVLQRHYLEGLMAGSVKA
jgi:multiple sugar transport system permease protein